MSSTSANITLKLLLSHAAFSLTNVNRVSVGKMLPNLYAQ